jgi:hypothetical protein
MTANNVDVIHGSFVSPDDWAASPAGFDGLRRALRLLLHYHEHEPSQERREELLEAVAAVQHQLAAMGQPCPFGRLWLPRARVVANRYSGPTGWTGPLASFYRLTLKFGFQAHAASEQRIELRLSGAVRSSVAAGAAPEIVAVRGGSDRAAVDFDRSHLTYRDHARPGGDELVVELARFDRAPPTTALLLQQLDAHVEGAPGQHWSEASVVPIELDACRRAPSCAVTCVYGCASTNVAWT